MNSSVTGWTVNSCDIKDYGMYIKVNSVTISGTSSKGQGIPFYFKHVPAGTMYQSGSIIQTKNYTSEFFDENGSVLSSITNAKFYLQFQCLNSTSSFSELYYSLYAKTSTSYNPAMSNVTLTPTDLYIIKSGRTRS